MYSIQTPHQIKITWGTSEDTLLVLSVEKYGKANWYKIVSNLYTKHIQQAKARWKGWSHPIINKRYWTLHEDVHLSYQKKATSRFLRQKFTEKYRTPWQCFFRSIILMALQVQDPFYSLATPNPVEQDLRPTTSNNVAELDATPVAPSKKTLGIKTRLVYLIAKKNVKKKRARLV